MREDFESILRDYGHNILLVRAATKTRCSCWNEKTQESPRTCPSCFGLGFVPIIEKHTVRTIDTSLPETLVRAIQGSAIGDVSVPGRIYFFRHSAKVQTGDLLVEVDWSETGRPIYSDGYVMKINHVDPKRWDGGQVAFQKTYAKDEPIEKEIRGIRIANSNGITNYELIQKEVR